MSNASRALSEDDEIRALHGRILMGTQDLSRLRDELPPAVLKAMAEELQRLQNELDQRVTEAEQEA